MEHDRSPITALYYRQTFDGLFGGDGHAGAFPGFPTLRLIVFSVELGMVDLTSLRGAASGSLFLRHCYATALIRLQFPGLARSDSFSPQRGSGWLVSASNRILNLWECSPSAGKGEPALQIMHQQARGPRQRRNPHYSCSAACTGSLFRHSITKKE